MAKTAKVSMFNVGDNITTSLGQADVIDVRGQAWVKVTGVKRSWWPTSELAPLNPEFAEKFAEVQTLAAQVEELSQAQKEAEAAAKAEEKAAKAAARKAKKKAEAEAEEVADQAEEPVTA